MGLDENGSVDEGEGGSTLSFVLVKTFQEFASAADDALRVVSVVRYFCCSLFECLFYRQLAPSSSSAGDELAHLGENINQLVLLQQSQYPLTKRVVMRR